MAPRGGRALLAGWLLAAASSAVAADDWAGACTGSARRAGDCFTVRGRLTTCNGVPNARIWIVGTQRILGVVDPADGPAGAHLLPPSLDAAMFGAPPCSKAAFGNYTVCPLTPARRGVMQRVCLAHADALSIRDDW
jgi:hypothetical protein